MTKRLYTIYLKYKFNQQSVFHLVFLPAIYEVKNFPEEGTVQNPVLTFIGFSTCPSNFTDK